MRKHTFTCDNRECKHGSSPDGALPARLTVALDDNSLPKEWVICKIFSHPGGSFVHYDFCHVKCLVEFLATNLSSSVKHVTVNG